MFRSVFGLLSNPLTRLAPILRRSVSGSKVVWDLTPACSIPYSRSSEFLGCSGVTLSVLTHIVGHFSLKGRRIPVLESHLLLTNTLSSLGTRTSAGLVQTYLRSRSSLGSCSWSAWWSRECLRPPTQRPRESHFQKVILEVFWGVQLIGYIDFLSITGREVENWLPPLLSNQCDSGVLIIAN